MKPSKNCLRLMFLHYSYLLHLLHCALDLTPPIGRWLVLKLMLGRLGKRVFVDIGVYFRYPKRVFIGNDVTLGRGCEFYPSWHNNKAIILLGDNVRVGPNVSFLAAGHDHSRLHLPDTSARIEIGDNVWIGANCSILQGVHVGNGAVIAAASVVTENVPPFKVYGGTPARELKDRIIAAEM